MRVHVPIVLNYDFCSREKPFHYQFVLTSLSRLKIMVYLKQLM